VSLRTGSRLSAKTDFVYVGAIPPWLPRFQPPNNLKIKKPSPTRNREGENKKELEIETFTYSRFHVYEVHPDCSSIAVGTRHCRVPTSVVYLTNLKSAVINNKESHPRRTHQPNNIKHESEFPPLVRKADLTYTSAECEIKCDRQF